MWGRSILLLALLGVVIAACRDNPVHVVPDPEIVEAEQVPSASEGQYYLMNVGETVQRFGKGAKPVLQDLLQEDVPVREAWYPTTVTPCLAPNAIEAMVVRLEQKDESIEALGFRSETEPFLLNCGIDTFEYYRLD